MLKAVRSLEIGTHHIEMKELEQLSDNDLIDKVIKAQDDRLFYVMEAIRRGYAIEELNEMTKIDLFFLDKMLHIYEIEQELAANSQDFTTLKRAKQNGFTDKKLLSYGR